MKFLPHSLPGFPLQSRWWLAVCVAAGLVGCANTDRLKDSVISLGGALTPYQIDVLQGNVVTREQVAALQTGMPREQVRALLGTPLLASAFHADRWDYVFVFRRQGQPVQRRQVTVWFGLDALERVQADGALPSEQDFVASLDVKRRAQVEPPLQATDAELKAFAAQNPVGLPALSKGAAPAVPATSYPPLEPR